jgi:acetyl-CoA carboxylase biotin carboxyl carrier protein
LDHLECVLNLMGKHEIAELEWENRGERLKLKTRHALPTAPETAHFYSHGRAGSGGYPPDKAAHLDPEGLGPERMQGKPSASSPPVSAGLPALPASNEKQVLSPFVGTFYRSPSPDSDPYAREGQVIKRGDVLCIIEAMKLMNEIDAEFPGKIKSVLVENGQPVEFGEPLFIIEV